ncbi:MAG: DUF2834 domain-containing protein [Sandaracinus sp.]|nr:DUF2834 domain-containing protein [Sandaracinus sp.]
MNPTFRFLVALGGFLAFAVYSAVIVLEHGYLGFVTDVALASDWGLQVVLDLVIALSLFLTWMVRDARERGLPAVPYVLGTLALGSVGALAYLVHREGAALRGAQSASASTEPA